MAVRYPLSPIVLQSVTLSEQFANWNIVVIAFRSVSLDIVEQLWHSGCVFY